MDEDSPIFDKGMDDDYWAYIEKPSFYVSREGTVNLETFGDLGIEEGHVEFHMTIRNHTHVLVMKTLRSSA